MNHAGDAIHFIATGGTIDSYYDGAIDTVVPREHSVVDRYLIGVKVDRPLQFSQACMVDSRQLTDDHRRDVLQVILQSEARKFIVTHGNYTLAETARFLAPHLRDAGKTVALVGASIPLEGVTMSDGGFNIGFAFAQIDMLGAGVYVCVAGRVFGADEAISYLEQRRFESIFSGTV